ncbi:hypothetical protein GCM10009846_25680 [Agrococcus versicolor]|uniref:Uncharacterized protein n=1 Tax=Agrococcus versicolor TaxID=501482 RepID=A0ABP5MLM7_9MICO
MPATRATTASGTASASVGAAVSNASRTACGGPYMRSAAERPSGADEGAEAGAEDGAEAGAEGGIEAGTADAASISSRRSSVCPASSGCTHAA